MAARPSHNYVVGGRWPTGNGHVVTEYYGAPAPAAAELFNYVIAIGKSRVPPKSANRVPGARPGYVLHYVRRGELWHRVGGRKFRLREGDICLVDRSKDSEQGNDLDTRMELWWIFFHGLEAPRLVAALAPDREPLFPRVPPGRFQSLFADLLETIRRKPTAHEARAHALLAAILAELFISRARRPAAAPVDLQRLKASQRTRAAMIYLSHEYSTRLGVKSLADRLRVSVGHFTRTFHQETGMTPVAYLNQLRVHEAGRLLTATDKTIGEIGRLVGVGDPLYFSRVFRKLMGVSPNSYRQQHRRGEAAPQGKPSRA